MTEARHLAKPTPDSFASTLARSGIELRRAETTTLQVNVGFLCNQSCRHCHLSAGPGRTEVMSRETMDAVESFAKRSGFSVIDLTGGAPELVPGIEGFLERLAPLAPRTLFRTNLTALAGRADLVDLLARLRVVVVASFTSLSASQTDTQRFVEADKAFHAALAEASGNGTLQRIMSSIASLLGVWIGRVMTQETNFTPTIGPSRTQRFSSSRLACVCLGLR